MKWTDSILNNFWPKLISLVLAIATWFYVFDLVNSDSFLQKKETAEEVFARYDFEMKEIPVKPVFVGKSPEGYRVVFDKVKVEPSMISVFGPDKVLSEVDDLKTDRINLAEYTRSVKINVGIHSSVRALRLKEKIVEVFVPIESLTKEEPKEE